MSKKVNKTGLDDVNGGAEAALKMYKCPNCNKNFGRGKDAGYRTVGSGCDSYTEVKCPYCGTWMRD